MTGKIIKVKRIEETILWKKLKLLGNTNSNTLIAELPTICEEAADRMKAMPATSSQYTLHDESHFLRVVELMAMVLGESIEQLNSIELCLLILTAYFHDQGMVMNEDEYEKLSTDAEFQLFRDNWYIDHPNQKEIQTQLQNSNLNDEERSRLSKLLIELDAALLTDYLRNTHAKRSSDYIIESFSSDKRLEVSGINLASILAKLCESHYSHTHELIPANGFNYDEQIGLEKINMPFIAIILRLADIMDFDADRTPDVLFRTIHFSSAISLQEWEKHRGIRGWEINKNLVRYSADYTHPAYQAAALKFMDWVDKELSECQNLCRNFPSEFERYKLLLPSSVDRSRIQPSNNSYIYHNLEIGLSRNEIVKLLMTDKLYNKPHVCIRELLQNSLDALRYRKALFSCDDMEWTQGKVEFLHDIDTDGYEIIQCKDNGSGMDRDIITRFFTNAGRSFYRSPEFERQRAIFRKKDIDYDPCSQFGIGFMSCFMLGDRIKIETRRDYGQGKKWGEPLVIEINGLGGLIVIRKGSDSQEIGTTVTITSRKKPSFIDEWTDNVILITALKHFSIATEFPIIGQCNIKELKGSVEIPVTPSYIPTLIEKAKINKESFITIEQEFSNLNQDLNGSIRESFLVNKEGLPALKNQEASWESKDESKRYFSLICSNKIHESGFHDQSQISIDGIHLCGVAGRPEWQDDSDVKMRLGNRPTHIEVNAYSLDVRGNLKPEISPARNPIDNVGFSRMPKWKMLDNLVNQASGRIWEQLLNEFIPKGLTHESFWKLLTVHKGNIHDIPLSCLWQRIAVPVIQNEKKCWTKISDLKRLTLQKNEENTYFELSDDQSIKLPLPIEKWEKNGVGRPNLQLQITSLIIATSKLSIEESGITFVVCLSDDGKITPSSLAISSEMSYTRVLPYINKAKDAIAVKTPIATVNSLHPLVKLCLNPQNIDPLSEFASTFVPCIVDAIYSKEQKKPLTKPNRWMKISAHHYFAVDWSKYQNNALKPPYKIWLDCNEIIEITEHELIKWRDS
jgi:hypothetical protein